MNREIKFRAWVNCADFEGEEKMNMLREPDVFIQKYTGFKDKHGKEIYEGDIVREKLIDYTEEQGWFWNYSTVEFEKGCWVLKEIGFDYSKYDSLMDYDHLYDACEDIEVCGNIFENPELLLDNS